MKNILIVVTLIAVITIGFYLNREEKSSQISQLESSQHRDQTITLRLGHNTPQNSALHQAAIRFSQDVYTRTNGELQVEVYPAQQLGNDHQMLEMAKEGTIDIVLTPTAKMSVSIPQMQYADLPFFFPSREDLYEMLDGEAGDILLKKLNTIGLVGVTFWENGFKHFTANTPLLTPDDFHGKKMRVMKSRIIMEQFKSLGAEPIAIDFHSTKQALKDGVVDGQENPLIAIVSMEFYKVQNYLTLSEHGYLGYVFSISKKSFQPLSSQMQNILIDSAKSITTWEREETHKNEKELLKTIEEAGVVVQRLSKESRLEFAKKTKNIVKKFEEVIGSDLISLTQEKLHEKYAEKDQEILIGIDTALSVSGEGAGLAIKRGAELAVDEINNAGGLLGKKLKIIVKNNRFSPNRGINNIKEFAAMDNLVAILGGKHSAVVSDEIQYVQEYKTPMIIPWATATNITENGYTDNYVFRVSANDRLAAPFIANNILKKYAKPAIIVENSIWGRSSLKSIKNFLANRGITEPTSIIYNRGHTDFSQEISQIIAAGNDSVIMVSNSKEGTAIVTEIAKQNNKLGIRSHWGILGDNFFTQNRDALKKLDFQFFQTFSFNRSSTKVREVAQKYLQTYGKESITQIDSPTGVAQAYDAIHLLALAIKKAGSTDRVKIKSALENLSSYNGLVKTYSQPFTKKEHDALSRSDYHMAKYDDNGKIILVSQ